jgi:hypothetical protein
MEIRNTETRVYVKPHILSRLTKLNTMYILKQSRVFYGTDDSSELKYRVT